MTKARQRERLEKKKLQNSRQRPSKPPVQEPLVINNDDQIERILTENGLIQHFDYKTDKRLYDADNMTIYIFFAEFDRAGRQRKPNDRGFSMIRCFTKEQYAQYVASVSRL